MAMYELDGNHLLPVRLGRSADAITLSHSLVAIQRQIVDVLRRPLFPLSWEELETGASLTALDATGQVVVVEVLERVDSTGLLAAMSRLTQAATAGRREIASRYAGGLGAFSQDWNEFREAMPAQVEAGPRLTILSASLEPDVVGGLGVLASSGLEIHEVDVRIVDESRIVVVVEKISGMDVAAGGPLLVARAPRPALAGSASSGSNGSRGMDAAEQAEHMSPVTGPIEIVMPSEPVTAPEAGGVDEASAAIPAGAFAATGAADALSELFEPVAVTAEQPQVHALSAQGGDEAPPEDPEEAGGAQPAGQAVPEPDEGTADVADGPVDEGTSDGAADDGPATDADRGAEHEAEHRAEAEPEAPRSRPEPGPESSDGAPQAPAAEPADDPGDFNHEVVDRDPAAGDHDAAGNVGSVGQDLADILSGDTVTVPAIVDLGEEPVADDAGHGGRSDSTDDSSAEERAVAALAGGVDILGGSSLSGGSGSAASAGSAPSGTPFGSASNEALGSGQAPQTGDAMSPAGSRTRMGRRSRAAHSQPEASSAAPAAQAWSTVAPNESRTEAPTGAVPLVSWEPLRGSADALDPVAEALGGDPSKSLLVQETAELAAVAASLGKPTQIIWQRLRRGIYHEAILSVEGVITLSDGRSFTDPTSAANAAQAVTDADGWRVWRVGVHGAHLGELRDDLADRGF